MSPSTENCDRCGKPIRYQASAQSITQWIFGGVGFCRCSQTGSETITLKVSRICPRCGNSLTESKPQPGTISQWVFKTKVCNCREVSSNKYASASINSPTPNLALQDASGADSARYVVTESLGEKEQIRTYQCFDLYLGKKVLMKVLTTKGTEGKRIIAFQEMAKTLSRLNHPRISRVLDLGVTSNQEPFLVLESAPGVNLSEHIKVNGKLNLQEALKLAFELSQALTDLQSLGIAGGVIFPEGISVSLNEDRKIIGVTIKDPGEICPSRKSAILSLASTLYYAITASDNSSEQFINELPDEKLNDSLKIFFKEWLADNEIKSLKSPEQFFKAFQSALSETDEIKEDFIWETPSYDKTKSLRPIKPIAILAGVLLTGVLTILILNPLNRSKTAESLEKPLVKPNSKMFQSIQVGEKENTTWSFSKSNLIKTAKNRYILSWCIDSDLKNLEKAYSINILKFTYCNLNGDGFLSLKDLPVMEMNFEECRLSAKALKNLSAFKNLQSLAFSTTGGIKSDDFGFLGGCEKLQYLYLSNEKITDKALEKISLCPSLISLTIKESSGFSGEGLLAFQRNDKLMRISLSGPHIKEDHIEAIKKLKSIKQIELANLDQALVDSKVQEFFELFSPQLKSSSLENIKVKNSLIDTIAGGKDLDFLFLRHLEDLSPADLQTLTSSPSLKTLILGIKNINSAHIDKIIKLKKLERLDLSNGASISEYDCNRLRKALPACKISLPLSI